MRSRLLDRLYSGLLQLDFGMPSATLERNLLRAANMALPRLGSPRLTSLEDEAPLRRAVMAIEAEIGDM